MAKMNLLLLFLLSPAVIISAQRYRKSTNPNDEPFLPIHPDYPYNPKLIKRGLDQQQQHQQQQLQHQLQQYPTQQQQQQALAQYTPELYTPKLDSRESYTANYNPSSYYAGTAYDPYTKSTGTSTNSLVSSSLYQPNYSTAYPSNPYSSLLNSYGSPYGTPSPGYGATTPGFGAAPYTAAAAGSYPNYYYQQPPYPFYPGYYGQPPYPPPPPPPPGYSPKHRDDDEDDDEDDKHREKSKKNGHHKNKLRNSDRDNQYVDGANYIISSAKDLDGESSTHRTPSHYNQLEHESDIRPRTVVLPKATYRLVSISGQQPENHAPPGGYIKVQQLEQLMRQALSRLLAQNAAQQANLAQLQQEASQQQQQQSKETPYISLPNTGIAKTGLAYVVNPTILNRVNSGQYNPSQLIVTGNKQSYGQKSPTTTVTLQQSHGIYIPPDAKTGGGEQSSPAEYGDYDQSDSATPRNQPSTVEPARNYSYSTYRPTQQTNLEDVNFGTKQKTKS